MKKEVIFTEKAPKPIGPYSQAIRSGRLLFVSGQIPLNPETGELERGNIESQTRLVMKNIESILEKAGCSFDHVVKTTIFLSRIGNFVNVNKIYEEYFKSSPPARSVIEVSNLPKEAEIEIELIAHL